MIQEHRVLVCPLNWGLGHATRCVPIIDALLKAGKEVILAADGFPLAWLRDYYPSLAVIQFEGIEARYSKGNSQVLAMLRQAPSFLWRIYKEHHQLQTIVAQYHIEAVISDNRFGLWCSDCKCYYITHQITIKMPDGWQWLEPLTRTAHRWFINHYDECWIPDYEGDVNLSGALSHGATLPKNSKYIGALSRFTQHRQSVDTSCKVFSTSSTDNSLSCSQMENSLLSRYPHAFPVVAILSGPEPQRTELEKKLLSLLAYSKEHALIVQGQPQSIIQKQQVDNITIVSHVSTKELETLLRQAHTIYCRSGYTTIMDLDALGVKACLIPTPGQTEQEYLAQIAMKNGHTVLLQKDL